MSASYGFEDATGEVKLKAAESDTKQIEPNTVTLMIDARRSPRRRWASTCSTPPPGRNWRPRLTIEVAISM